MVPSGFVRNYANICLMMDHQLLHEGIGRAFYSTMVGHEIVILHEYIKKTPQTPDEDLRIACKRLKEVRP